MRSLLWEPNSDRTPANLSVVDAAAVPTSAMAASQALREIADVSTGQTVLVTGASGGVGSFAVQIAKTLGAEVTGGTPPAPRSATTSSSTTWKPSPWRLSAER